DVGHERQHGLAGLRGELRRRTLDRIVVPAVHRDARALLREHLRHGATQPLGAAAHQGDAAGEAEIHRWGNLPVGGQGVRCLVSGVRWCTPDTRHLTPDASHTVAGTATASTRTAQHLSSAIFAYGSSTGLVSRFAAASRKWNGTNTWPRATRAEMRHELTIVLRREVSRVRSPSSNPSSRASSGWISTIGVGSRWSKPEARRV